MAFLELSGDDVVDPDSAVSAMEMIAFTLQESSLEERAALRRAVDEALKTEKKSRKRPQALNFFKNFFDALGLD